MPTESNLLELIHKRYRRMLPDGLLLGMGDLTDRLNAEHLSRTEREEYRTFKNSRRKDEFLMGRHLVRFLAEEAGLDRNEFEIRKDSLGKPFGIFRDREFHLSLAHSDEKVIAGLSESLHFGVDLEPAARTVDERLRERMLHEEERSRFEGEPLVRIWTLKEAMVKLEGRGLRTNLNRIVLWPEPGEESEFTGRIDDEKTARICSFQHEGYWVAVASYR